MIFTPHQIWLGDQIEKNEMDGACSAYGGEERRILMGRLEGKKPLRRLRPRWDYNIRMDLQEVGCRGMDWIELAKDRDRWWAVVNVAMSLRVQ
jgi:hypothetical protein